MKKIWLLSLWILTFNFAFAQININDFNQNFEQNPKPIFMYFSTDWCGICKIQTKEIENNEVVKSQLNSDVYFLSLDGESKDEIQFLNYNFKASTLTSKTHSLVLEFVDPTEVSFPLWIILNEKLEIIGKYSGLIKSKKLEKLIQQIKKE